MEQNLKLDLIKLVKASKDPYYFLTEYVTTVDEREGILKKFPKYSDRKVCKDCKLSFELKEGEINKLEFGLCPKCNSELQVPYLYLKVLTDTWKYNKKVIIPKTRQMMVSWLCVGLHLWLALFNPNQTIIFQSETEEKAKELIKRLKDIWVHLPDIIRLSCPLAENPSQTGFKFSNGSRIRSVPQGVTQLTGLTVSAIFFDEMGIQDLAEETYIQTIPATAGGGRMTIVGTPNGHNFFYRLVHDMKEGDVA